MMSRCATIVRCDQLQMSILRIHGESITSTRSYAEQGSLMTPNLQDRLSHDLSNVFMLAMPLRLKSLSFTPRIILPLLKVQKVKGNAMGLGFSRHQVLTIITDMSDDELIALEHTRDSIYFNKLTFASSLLSAGGAIETCLAVATRKVKNAIAVIRPPGHHAEHDKTMGFCLFNNVSIAARVCQNKLGESCRKILIVDWYVLFPTM